MSKKMVLVIDQDSYRAERLLFVLRLAGYDSSFFRDVATAVNWVKHVNVNEEQPCLLINDLDDPARATQTISALVESRAELPTILVQRCKGAWHALAALVDSQSIFVSEPATVMHTLERLPAILCGQPSMENTIAA